MMRKQNACILLVAIAAVLLGQANALAEPPSQWDIALYRIIQNQQAQLDELLNANSLLQARIEGLEAKMLYASVETGEINGLSGPHLIFTGVNLHIRSGSGSTDDGGSLTGLGNLVIGYDEMRGGMVPAERAGSHNLVVGSYHGFTNCGGLVAGYSNQIDGPWATVLGGQANRSSGFASSVSGGRDNNSTDWGASIGGGRLNISSGIASSVTGGSENEASGENSTVNGGWDNSAEAMHSSICGGNSNTTTGLSSSVSGGGVNTATHDVSTVSGGFGNTTTTDFDHVP